MKFKTWSFRHALTASLLAASATGCSLNPYGDQARLIIQMGEGRPSTARYSNLSEAFIAPSRPFGSPMAMVSGVPLPSSVDGFNCYAVNVMGPGILDPWGHSGQPGPAPTPMPSAGPSPMPTSSGEYYCKYPGVMSQIFSGSDAVVELKVPAGPERRVQMIAIHRPDGCQTGADLEKIIVDGLAAQGCDPNAGDACNPFFDFSMHEVGITKTDLFSDKTVEIQNSYDPAASSGMMHNDFPFACTGDGMMGPMPTGPMPEELPMYGGWTGGTLAIWGASGPSSVYPPTFDYGLYTMTGAETSLLTTPGNTSAYRLVVDGNAYFPRADFAFDLQGRDLSTYSGVGVHVIGYGGTSTGASLATCMSGAGIDSNYGLQIRVWKDTGYTWSSLMTSSGFTTFQPMMLGFDSTSPDGALTNLIHTSSTPAGNYIHVSIRGIADSQSAIRCSELMLREVRVFLYP